MLKYQLSYQFQTIPWYFDIFTVFVRITVAGDVATSDIWGLNDIVCEKLAPSSEHVGGCRVFLHPPTVSHRQRNLALRRKRPLGPGATRRLTPVAIVSRSQTLSQIQFTENKDPMLEKSVFLRRSTPFFFS